MPSRLTGFVCPTVSMVTTGHATGVEKTLLSGRGRSVYLYIYVSRRGERVLRAGFADD